MVIVTHKPSVLPLVTRIIVIVGNSIVLDGPRDVVLQQLQQKNVQTQAAPEASHT
jgi:ATP-binding cassette subfamily C protein LapB